MTAYKSINGELVALTQDEMDNELAKATMDAKRIADANANRYMTNRKKEYPPIDDIVEALIENQEGDPAALNKVKALRAQVKAKYPKNG